MFWRTGGVVYFSPCVYGVIPRQRRSKTGCVQAVVWERAVDGEGEAPAPLTETPVEFRAPPEQELFAPRLAEPRNRGSP